ncbi:hypothetical protein [Nocardioides pacificus]
MFGAVLTAGVSLIQQRRDAATESQRRADEATRRRDEAELRRQDRVEAKRAAEASSREEAKIAARIVRGDVEHARARMQMAVKNGRYWSRAYSLPQESWIQYREKIARHLDADQWNIVSRFFRSVANFDAGAEVARAKVSGQSRVELSQRMGQAMQRALDRSDAAIEVLANFTRDDPIPDAEEVAADADASDA